MAGTVDIDRPVEAVWSLLEEVRRLPELSPSTEAVHDAPARLTEAGQTFRQVVRQLGRCFESDWEVLAITPGSQLTIEGSVGYGVRYRITERLEPLGEQRTRLHLVVDYQLPLGPVGRLASRLGVERLARREAAQVLQAVRALVEREHPIA